MNERKLSLFRTMGLLEVFVEYATEGEIEFFHKNLKYYKNAVYPGQKEYPTDRMDIHYSIPRLILHPFNDFTPRKARRLIHDNGYIIPDFHRKVWSQKN